jgi:1-acyl-sn-glycerol-3-phosphate acyltransferase
MKSVRAGFRLTAFVVCALAHYGACLLLLPLTRMNSTAGRHLHNRVAISWGRKTCAIVGLRLHVEGEPPATPFILVSNHLGYIDIITLMAVMPAVFVSKAEVSGWPLMGRLARAGNTIFVDRELRRDVVRVNALIEDVLTQGRGVVFFPEGTSSSGESVQPFRSSLLDPAVRIGHPVHYATLSYRTPEGSPAAATAVCWWGDMTFFDHFWAMLQLPRIDVRVVFGAQSVRSESRHELAERLQRAVSAQLDSGLPAAACA